MKKMQSSEHVGYAMVLSLSIAHQMPLKHQLPWMKLIYRKQERFT